MNTYIITWTDESDEARAHATNGDDIAFEGFMATLNWLDECEIPFTIIRLSNGVAEVIDAGELGNAMLFNEDWEPVGLR